MTAKAKQHGGLGVEHIHSITSHYVAMSRQVEAMKVKLRAAVDMLASVHQLVMERGEHCHACALYFELREQEVGNGTV